MSEIRFYRTIFSEVRPFTEPNWNFFVFFNLTASPQMLGLISGGWRDQIQFNICVVIIQTRVLNGNWCFDPIHVLDFEEFLFACVSLVMPFKFYVVLRKIVFCWWWRIFTSKMDVSIFRIHSGQIRDTDRERWCILFVRKIFSLAHEIRQNISAWSYRVFV